MRIGLFSTPLRKNSLPTALPWGVMYLASVLKEDDISVEIVDINGHRYSKEKVRKIIKKKRFDAIGISALITAYPYMEWLASTVKEIYPETPIAVGGSAVSPWPRFVLENAKADVACIGEGEAIIAGLFTRMVDREDLSDIPGIAFRKNGKVVVTQEKQRIQCLDDLPLPAYDLVPMHIYNKNNTTRPYFKEYCKINHISMPDDIAFNIQLFASRGCPFSCTFCYRNFGREVRRFSVDYVMQHLEYLERKYNTRYFHFNDETFNTSKSWIVEFCQRLIAKKKNYFFGIAGARINGMDEEQLDLLKEAGCVEIHYGIESGSQKILDEMKKNLNVEAMKKVIKATLKRGMLAPGVFLFGFPGDSRETLEESIDFCKDVGYRRMGIYRPCPYPGTMLYHDARRMGKIKNDRDFVFSLDDADAGKLVINLSSISDRRSNFLVAMANVKLGIHYALKEKRMRLLLKQLVKVAGLYFYIYVVPNRWQHRVKAYLKKCFGASQNKKVLKEAESV